MGESKLKKYKDIIDNSFDIVDNLIHKTSYPTIIMDKDYKIIFVNEPVLRLYDTSFDGTFMKNYFGTYCRTAEEYTEFTEFYDKVVENKKPVYVDSIKNKSYIMIFPLVSPKTGEVEYIHNIFIVEEFHLTSRQKNDLKFNHDYVHFAHQLSLLLETKDKYTANHSSNVAKYSELLGMAIGIEGAELNELKLAANLHDIGKVNIPNRILIKREKLTDEEYNIIKQHPVYSGKILDVFKEFGDVRTSGLHHHERYDGTGYPNSISYADTPLFARIIAIADSFDAMTTDRSYRNALPLEKAISELVNNKYTQFDPFLVDKFINLDLDKIINSLSDFDGEYKDKYTIPKKKLPEISENIRQMFEVIEPYVILENLVNYNFYGFIISKDLRAKYGIASSDDINCNRSEFLYKNKLIDDLAYDGYLADNWEMCLKPKKIDICNHCPVDGCLNINSTYYKKSKLINSNGDIKYLNTLLHPVYDKETGDTYIVELLKDATVNLKYTSKTAAEFFDFVDNISRIFTERDEDFSIIYNEMRGLCNWIAKKINVSEHKIELLNKALSICDLGIIALLDSNEYSFESLRKIRANKKHIEIIYSLITKLETFSDIKDIVLYHHVDYNDTSYDLSGEQVPIQSYIIAAADYLLTYTVMGNPIDETLHYLGLLSGVQLSPLICEGILHGSNRDELIEILGAVRSKKKFNS